MKKIVAILFHYNYATFLKVKEELNSLVDLKLYSSKLLSEGKQDVNALYKDINTGDLLLLNRNSSDGIWGEIEGIINENKAPKVYIGEEMGDFIKDKNELENAIVCNNYLTCNGKFNFINMIKYICNTYFGDGLEYEKPREIPWNGIFHPNYSGYFENTDDYFRFKKFKGKGVIGIVTSRAYWINDDIDIEKNIISVIENSGYDVIPIFTYYNKDKDKGGIGNSESIKEFFLDNQGKSRVDAVIKLISFGLVETNEALKNYDSDNVLKKLNCPIFKPIVSSNMTIDQWSKSVEGATKDISWSVALPEMEGNIEPIFVGAVEKLDDTERRTPVKDRCRRVVMRAIRHIELKKKANSDKKIVFILNNSPCASIEANVGSASHLDTMESIINILKAMKKRDYTVNDIPKDGKALAKEILNKKAVSEFRWTTINEIVEKGGAIELLPKAEYLNWFNQFSVETRNKIIDAWGNPPGEELDGVPPSMVYDGQIVISGLKFGNVIVAVQPKRGCAGSRCDGNVCKILHDPSVPPTHQYIATYRYFEEKFKADLIVHMGTHGNLEFLPGKSVGLSQDCYSDICIGNMPYINVYNADNPPEGTIAKRRGLATIIDHMQVVAVEGGPYDSLAKLETLINQYEDLKYKDNGQKHILEHLIGEEIKKAKLDNKIDITSVHDNIDGIIKSSRKFIALISNMYIADGQHILGQIPKGDRLLDFLNSIVRYEGIEEKSLRAMVAELLGLDFKCLIENKEVYNNKFKKMNSSILIDLDKISKKIIELLINEDKINFNIFKGYEVEKLEMINKIEANFKERLIDISNRVKRSNEVNALLDAMEGNYIMPGPAGVLSRGRDDILPTGRNFYTMDPTTLPTRASFEIGKRLAEKVIDKHLKEEGKYPENFAMYWMANDFMWADGEGMAQLMYLMGAEPVWEKSGKVKTFKVIPLENLQRPRIDITVKISGILRDAFLDRIELLDEVVRAISALNEPIDMNYVRKHSLEAIKKNGGNKDRSESRIFGSKSGTYFSAVSGLIYSSSWKEKDDIADVFMYYNGYSYGKNRYGEESFKELKNSLSTVDITYNKVVSDEHDLLGCCTYFATHGGMTAAARKVSKNEVKTYYGDTREVTDVDVRDLKEEIDRVVKGKLLNPKWIEGQKRHGYRGASDISQMVGRVYGWDATTDEVDDKLFDGIAETFVFNDDNRKFFEQENPWALEEISRRLMEAYKRNLWETDDEIIENLEDYYIEMEGWIEEGMGEMSGNYQGGSIDVVDIDEVVRIKEKLENI